MANSKQATKRIKVARTKTAANRIQKANIRSALKKSRLAILNKEADSAELLKEALTALDKATSKKVMHKNTAARTKSKLVKAFNQSTAN